MASKQVSTYLIFWHLTLKLELQERKFRISLPTKLRPNIMKTNVLPSNPVDETDSGIQAILEIKSWIENNTILRGKKFIWRIGIGHCNDMNLIATDVRRNYQYKHYKQWKLNSFEEAFNTLKSLNKYAFIFKSQRNNYLKKGEYIFVYKTPCESKTRQLFYKTLNS